MQTGKHVNNTQKGTLGDSEIEPRTFLLWDDSANYYTTVPPSLDCIYFIEDFAVILL